MMLGELIWLESKVVEGDWSENVDVEGFLGLDDEEVVEGEEEDEDEDCFDDEDEVEEVFRLEEEYFDYDEG